MRYPKRAGQRLDNRANVDFKNSVFVITNIMLCRLQTKTKFVTSKGVIIMISDVYVLEGELACLVSEAVFPASIQSADAFSDLGVAALVLRAAKDSEEGSLNSSLS